MFQFSVKSFSLQRAILLFSEENLLVCCKPFYFAVKLTVQFETEGNGQNEIVSHMDRSEVKL